jgi:hypothetical protein
MRISLNGDVQAALDRALKEVGPADLIAALKKLSLPRRFRRQTNDTMLKAIQAQGILAARSILPTQVASALCSPLLDGSPVCREAAAVALRQLAAPGPALVCLDRALIDPDPKVRQAVVATMSAIAVPLWDESMLVFIALGDQSDDVRNAAMDALASRLEKFPDSVRDAIDFAHQRIGYKSPAPFLFTLKRWRKAAPPEISPKTITVGLAVNLDPAPQVIFEEDPFEFHPALGDYWLSVQQSAHQDWESLHLPVLTALALLRMKSAPPVNIAYLVHLTCLNESQIHKILQTWVDFLDVNQAGTNFSLKIGCGGAIWDALKLAGVDTTFIEQKYQETLTRPMKEVYS